jgi:hypothetical protein
MVDSVAATLDTIIANGGDSCNPSAQMRRRSPQGSAIRQEM